MDTELQAKEPPSVPAPAPVPAPVPVPVPAPAPVPAPVPVPAPAPIAQSNVYAGHNITNEFENFKSRPGELNTRTSFFSTAGNENNRRLFYYFYNPSTRANVSFRSLDYNRDTLKYKLIDKVDTLKVWVYLFDENGVNGQPKGSGDVVLEIYLNAGLALDVSNPYKFPSNKVIVDGVGQSTCRPSLHTTQGKIGTSTNEFITLKEYGIFIPVDPTILKQMDERTKNELFMGPKTFSFQDGTVLSSIGRTVSLGNAARTAYNKIGDVGTGIAKTGSVLSNTWNWARGNNKTKAGKKKHARKNRRTKKQYKK